MLNVSTSKKSFNFCLKGKNNVGKFRIQILTVSFFDKICGDSSIGSTHAIFPQMQYRDNRTDYDGGGGVNHNGDCILIYFGHFFSIAA